MPAFLVLLFGGWLICSAAATEAVSSPADPLAGLDAAELQDILQWLSRHTPDPAALSQEALNRAALRSLLQDSRMGASILESSGTAAIQAIPPLHARLGPDSAYAQPGPLTEENLAALSHFLTALPAEVTTLMLDLRAPQPPGPLSGSAGLASLFVPEKTPLFLRQAPPGAPQLLTSTLPVWSGRVWLLIDEGTPPPAELAAHLLARQLPVLTFGSPTSGRLVETTDRPLGGQHLIRLPSATAHWPDGKSLTGTRLLPQIPISPRPEARQRLFSLNDPAGLTRHLTETDRPRQNEAALIARTRPETDPTPPPVPALPDPVLQQACDLLRTAAFLKLDAPDEIKKAQPGTDH